MWHATIDRDLRAMRDKTDRQARRFVDEPVLKREDGTKHLIRYGNRKIYDPNRGSYSSLLEFVERHSRDEGLKLFDFSKGQAVDYTKLAIIAFAGWALRLKAQGKLTVELTPAMLNLIAKHGTLTA